LPRSLHSELLYPFLPLRYENQTSTVFCHCLHVCVSYHGLWSLVVIG
jgi:hypothetical protein